jgi:hypothetical protein|tara:strand:+ start:368 stop:598 length:231 start_codon:yes stop_codon:yes gene_type:complete
MNNKKKLSDVLKSKPEKLSQQEKLVKSIVKETKINQLFSAQQFENLKEYYTFKTKYKNYLRFKKCILYGAIGMTTR